MGRKIAKPSELNSMPIYKQLVLRRLTIRFGLQDANNKPSSKNEKATLEYQSSIPGPHTRPKYPIHRC